MITLVSPGTGRPADSSATSANSVGYPTVAGTCRRCANTVDSTVSGLAAGCDASEMPGHLQTPFRTRRLLDVRAIPAAGAVGPTLAASNRFRPKGEAMSASQTRDWAYASDLSPEEWLIHEWRIEQLLRLGVPYHQAERVARDVDWHGVAALVEQGCPARLAVDSVR